MAPLKTCGYGVCNKEGKLEPVTFEQRSVGAEDVAIEVEYAGICHSDTLTARGGWGPVDFPCVPGHEIIGKVTSVGPNAKKFKAGDVVAVGCFVDSCGKCSDCKSGEENYCTGEHGPIMTYNHKMLYSTNDKTFGGYARDIVVKEHFVFAVPKELQGKPEAAPLLCAGVTVYNPMKEHKMDRPGAKIGVLGLGGLGHMAVKFGAAFGAEVTVLSRGSKKEALAKELGAKHYVDTSVPENLGKGAKSLDFIISTVPAGLDINPYMGMLKKHGIFVVVGVGELSEPMKIHGFPLCFHHTTLTGSLVAGTTRTEEMLKFCAEKNVLPMCEIIEMKDANTAWDRMEKSDVKFRFVMEVKKTCVQLGA